MVKLDATILIQIVNFIVLIWALNTVLYKPIRKILFQRKEKVTGLEQSISDSVGRAQANDQRLAAGIKAARAQGLTAKENLIQSAAEKERLIIENINRKAQSDLTAMRQRLDVEMQSVREALQVELDDFANAVGQKILGRAI